jgi:hypothetical protein
VTDMSSRAGRRRRRKVGTMGLAKRGRGGADPEHPGRTTRLFGSSAAPQRT